MEEIGLGPVDFKHGLYVKNSRQWLLLLGCTRLGRHGKARHKHPSCYFFTLFGASISIFVRHHPLSVVSDRQEFDPQRVTY